MGKVRKKDEGRERAIRKAKVPKPNYSYTAKHPESGWVSENHPNYPFLFMELLKAGFLSESDLIADIPSIRAKAEMNGIVFEDNTWKQ